MPDPFDVTLRYQRTPFARCHVRPLSLAQQEILYRCDGGVTIADLADATRCPPPEIRAALGFLSRHGLVRTLLSDPRLVPSSPLRRPAPPVARPVGCLPRLLARLKRARIHLSDRLWERLTWDVHRR